VQVGSSVACFTVASRRAAARRLDAANRLRRAGLHNVQVVSEGERARGRQLPGTPPHDPQKNYLYSLQTMNEWSIRVTPPSGEEVEFIMDEFEQFIACKEIGKKHKKLHYHIYCKTTLNHNSKGESEIRNYLQLMCDTTRSGNGFFSCVAAHNGTKGYVVKEQVDVDQLTQSKGFTKEQLSSLLDESRAYRRAKEAKRKQEQRKQTKSAIEICNDIVAYFTEDKRYGYTHPSTFRTKGMVASAVLHRILYLYRNEDEGLAPPRSTVERMIVTIMMKLGWTEAVEQYYIPHFMRDYSNFPVS